MNDIADTAYPGQLILHEESEDQRAKWFVQIFAVADNRAANGSQFQCSIIFIKVLPITKTLNKTLIFVCSLGLSLEEY